MSANNPNQLENLVLNALEAGDYGGRARGGDAARPQYLLNEIPLPDGGPALGGKQRTFERRGAASAALVEDLAALNARKQEEAPVSAAVECASCGTNNPSTSKFCGACGHQLSVDAGLSDAHRIPAPMPMVLVSINEDGTDGARMDLEFADSVIGRAGDVRFPTDAFLSPKHARLSAEGQSVFVEDLYSLNGTYVKLRDEARLTPGDTFLMGRQVLRFEKFEHTIVPKARSSDGTRYMGSPPPGGQFKLLQVGIGGIIQNVFCVHDSGAIIGREKGDVIFPRDKFMSGRHAQIFPREDGNYYLVDLNSSNGTWVKIWERRQLSSGDFIFLGQQLFRIEF